jgi:hypothetical protein
MLSKTGEQVIWHWAHLAEQPNCRAGEESEWHLAWKGTAADDRVEVQIGNRRADVLTKYDYAIEFQKSPIEPDVLRGRERDWKRKLIWVFDVADAQAKGTLKFSAPPGRNDDFWYIDWPHAYQRVTIATCHIFLDAGGDKLFWLGKWTREAPRRGYGWVVPRDWFIKHVIEADEFPVPPGGTPQPPPRPRYRPNRATEDAEALSRVAEAFPDAEYVCEQSAQQKEIERIQRKWNWDPQKQRPYVDPAEMNFPTLMDRGDLSMNWVCDSCGHRTVAINNMTSLPHPRCGGRFRSADLDQQETTS